jgi:hypothetical protein
MRDIVRQGEEEKWPGEEQGQVAPAVPEQHKPASPSAVVVATCSSISVDELRDLPPSQNCAARFAVSPTNRPGCAQIAASAIADFSRM